MLNNHDDITREELLELAELEMTGHLDEVDAARLERAFRSATPVLQDEVIALQERLALEPSLRDSGAPAGSLRLRVLAAVAAAAEEDARAAAPIATIGRGASRAPVASVDPSAGADRLARELLAQIERTNPPVTIFWRAAALFLLAALVVTLYFNREFTENARTLRLAVDNRLAERDIRELASGVAGFDFSRSIQHRLQPASAGISGEVLVYVDPGSKRVLVIALGCENLGTVELRGFVDASAGTNALATQFRAKGPAHAEVFEFDPAAMPTTFELIGVSAGAAVFRSA